MMGVVLTGCALFSLTMFIIALHIGYDRGYDRGWKDCEKDYEERED